LNIKQAYLITYYPKFGFCEANTVQALDLLTRVNAQISVLLALPNGVKLLAHLIVALFPSIVHAVIL
jgi:hypothetical protein